MARVHLKMLCGAALLSMLAACMTSRQPAPVSERTQAPQPATATKPAPTPPPATPAPATGTRPAEDPTPEFYTVKRGDTLYTIALDHGLDYKDLREWNNIENPNVIRVGQQLRLRPPTATSVVTAPLKAPPKVDGRPVVGTPLPPVAGGESLKTQPKAVKVPYSDQAYAQLSNPVQASPAKPVETPPVVRPEIVKPEEKTTAGDDDEKVDWAWPASGKVLTTFNESTNLKGVGIAGKAGQPVLASAPGKVLYSGDGIRGYGKLIIIKHNKAYISVYAHNSHLLVKEGQSVVKGQKIADMGATDSDQVKLHFEIRRYGKPVDPLKLLPDHPA